VVGANVHEGWGGRVQVPVYQVLPETQVVAICNAHLETAQEACREFNVPHAFSDYLQMVRSPDIDAVSIATRVALHHPIALAALQAGKHVYCEWPLAVSSEQADELVGLARRQGRQNALGAQAHGSPQLNYMRELVSEGYLGRLLTFQMSIVLGSALNPRAQHHWWLMQRGEGGDALTIPCGHAVEVIRWCLGEVAEVAGATETMVKESAIAETKEKVNVTSIDTVAFAARLANGAAGGVYATWASLHSGGWRLEAYGTEGTLVASTSGSVQTSAIQLSGAKRGQSALEPLVAPERLHQVSEFPETDPRYNVAALVRRFTRAIHGQGKADPDFADGLKLHQILEAVVSSSENRRWVKVGQRDL